MNCLSMRVLPDAPGVRRSDTYVWRRSEVTEVPRLNMASTRVSWMKTYCFYAEEEQRDGEEPPDGH